MKTICTAAGLTMLAAFAIAPAFAQQPPTSTRAKGVIESFDGSTLALKPENGADMTIKLTDNAAVFGVEPAKIADIKIGDFIAVGATPQPDGSQKAIVVNIFAESMRGIGEGFRPWDRPNTTMTNATVDSTVAGTDGQVVTVKYKDGSQKIVIGPDAAIRVYVPSDKSELKSGAHIAMPRIEKLPDGTLQTARIYVGRSGVVPQ